jgi:hypothetical protein
MYENLELTVTEVEAVKYNDTFNGLCKLSYTMNEAQAFHTHDEVLTSSDKYALIIEFNQTGKISIPKPQLFTGRKEVEEVEPAAIMFSEVNSLYHKVKSYVQHPSCIEMKKIWTRSDLDKFLAELNSITLSVFHELSHKEIYQKQIDLCTRWGMNMK